jgi:hypothetical protein
MLFGRQCKILTLNRTGPQKRIFLVASVNGPRLVSPFLEATGKDIIQGNRDLQGATTLSRMTLSKIHSANLCSEECHSAEFQSEE